MNNRERFIKSLRFEPVDRPAKTDMFCLVEEAFGESFPPQEALSASSGATKERLLQACADLYLKTAERYDLDAIFVYHLWETEDYPGLIRLLKKEVKDRRAILALVPGAFWGMELIEDHYGFAERLAEDRPGLHEQAKEMLARAIRRARVLVENGADIIYVPNDQAYNFGPYFSPRVYEELVLPYAQAFYREVRSLGRLGVYHTDGNIMALLEMIMAAGAHALQSIDPMAGMDIKEVKKRTYGKLALIGNVQCSLLQEGPEAAIRASARYCLKSAAPGSGYVFMASNSIFPGLPLDHYHIMQDEYNRFVRAMDKTNDRNPVSTRRDIVKCKELK